MNETPLHSRRRASVLALLVAVCLSLALACGPGDEPGKTGSERGVEGAAATADQSPRQGGTIVAGTIADMDSVNEVLSAGTPSDGRHPVPDVPPPARRAAGLQGASADLRAGAGHVLRVLGRPPGADLPPARRRGMERRRAGDGRRRALHVAGPHGPGGGLRTGVPEGEHQRRRGDRPPDRGLPLLEGLAVPAQRRQRGRDPAEARLGNCPSTSGARTPTSSATTWWSTGPSSWRAGSPSKRPCSSATRNYFEAGKPYLDRLVFRQIPEKANQVSQLLSGEPGLRRADPGHRRAPGREGSPNQGPVLLVPPLHLRHLEHRLAALRRGVGAAGPDHGDRPPAHHRDALGALRPACRLAHLARRLGVRPVDRALALRPGAIRARSWPTPGGRTPTATASWTATAHRSPST